MTKEAWYFISVTLGNLRNYNLIDMVSNYRLLVELMKNSFAYDLCFSLANICGIRNEFSDWRFHLCCFNSIETGVFPRFPSVLLIIRHLEIV